MLNALNAPLTGKVAAKVHSGEEGNQNFLHPEFWRPVVEAVGATVVECNTAYPGARNTTAKHKNCWKSTVGRSISRSICWTRRDRIWSCPSRTASS